MVCESGQSTVGMACLCFTMASARFLKCLELSQKASVVVYIPSLGPGYWLASLVLLHLLLLELKFLRWHYSHI